ncbi:MAG: aspartate aminotransferase family protein [Steroidobacteraceae bacterium]
MQTHQLDNYWMPFTANRQFKKDPRLVARAEGMHYYTTDGRKILDAVAGLWCVNAGHARPEIRAAIAAQLETLDYAPAFQVGHEAAFSLATRLAGLAPGDLNRVFFVNSGSEAVDTALKIALAYHRVRGDAGRTRLIGRERGYHGVGFGGISVGGISPNRRMWSNSLIPGVDHLPHTHDPKRNAFSRGLPKHGAELAEELERIVSLHDASTVAAVIVEPIAGSTGVLLPPVGYLARLREICDRHGILLIFDEVITGFGRTGAPFAAEEFGVTPDIITMAKGLTNGVVPMGAVIARQSIHDAFMQGPESAIELFHGYTYSAHPLACAAAHASLDIYERDNLFRRARDLSASWERSVHALRDLPHVIDIRNYGLVAGIELAPIAGQPGSRAFSIYRECFRRGLLVRQTADIIALSPPLIISDEQIAQIFAVLGEVLAAAR